jgi:trk system potassium uptake protein TrkH
MMMGLLGGCAASTSGGIKFVRSLIIYKHGLREMKRLLHPKIVSLLHLGKVPLSDHLVETVRGFMAIFILVFFGFILLLVATGLDFESAFGATIACLSNVGASIGDVFDTFLKINTPSKWILMMAMLMGRLELLTLLVLLNVAFWRK